MELIGSADFTVSPPGLNGMTLTTNQAQYRDNHSVLGYNQQVVAQFQIDGGSLMKTVEVSLVGLVSRLGSSEGFAPITLSCNGQPFVLRYTMPGGGWAPNRSAFQVPPALLRPGTNSLTLQVASDAQSYFWLYNLGVDLSPMPYHGETLTALLGTTPPTVSSGMTVLRNDGQSKGDHYQYAPNQGLAVGFDLTHSNAANDLLMITMSALVSQLGSSEGYSPIDLLINGTALVSHFTVPGGGWKAHTCEFRVPPDLLKDGPNQVEVRVNGDARSYFWLYSLAVTKYEFYQELDSVQLSVSPPTTSGVTVVSNDGWFASDHHNYGGGEQIILDFSHTPSLPLCVKFTGLVSRSGDQAGYAPIELAINGTTFVSNYTVPGDGWNYADSVFLVPGHLVQEGSNRLVLKVLDSKTYFWLRNVSLLALFDGPKFISAMRTAADSYAALGNISQVPLDFLLQYPSSVTQGLDGLVELDDSLSLTREINALNHLNQVYPQFSRAIHQAWAQGQSVNLAGRVIAPDSQAAADLKTFQDYVAVRGDQEYRRLVAIQNRRPLSFDYTYGADVAHEVSSRWAQITPVQHVGGRYQFTDNQTGTTYAFPTRAEAESRRSDYLLFVKAEVVDERLRDVEAAAGRLLVLPGPQQQNSALLAVPLLVPFLVGVVAIGVVSIYTSFKAIESLPPADQGKGFPMNWYGWVNDWSSMISYDYMNVQGIGYLKPGGIWNVNAGGGQRQDQSLEDPANIGFYNYVWMPNSDHIIRLSKKDPRENPPGEIVHSQLAGGKDVGCAGELQFFDGYFRYVNTMSGHYYKLEPNWDKCREDVIAAIASLGYDVSKITGRPALGYDPFA